MGKELRKKALGGYKLGFTLVELLAVIVILAVILVIAVPKIMETIESSKKGTIETTAKMIANSADKEYMNRITLDTLDVDNDPITCREVTKLSDKDYSSCKIIFDNDGKSSVTLIGRGKFEGYRCSGTKADITCTKEEINVYKESILNGAYPRLDEGMIPVQISNAGVVTTVDPTSSNWYSYASKKWANVVLVKTSGTKTREYYKTNYNVTIDEADILAYLVWIPRYNYTLFNVAGNAATYTDGACTANCPQVISIEFEDSNASKKTGSTNGTKLTHPAFTYDDRELDGIWVGKFETTGTASTPTIKKGIQSLRSQNVSTQFNTSLKFGIDTQYGLDAESRMTKNSEWGAVAYLSASTYGLGTTEIQINNNSSYITGSGTGTTYGSLSTYPQSTTGNIYGVFDMNGGAWEYVMGVLEDSNGNGRSGYTGMSYTAAQASAAWGETSGNAIGEYNSGYNGLIYRPEIGSTTHNTYYKTNGLKFPNNKYYKIYNTTTTWYSNTSYLGEALGETRGWNSDYQYFVSASYPWFIRGGSYCNGVGAGAFSLYSSNGYAISSISFRVVIM